MFSLVVLAVVGGLASCQSNGPVAERSDDGAGIPPAPSGEARPLPSSHAWLPLVGREDFSVSDLTQEQQTWYHRLHDAIDASRDAMVERAQGDDAYDYGRWLFQYNSALLLGLRATGDLRFLDEVDAVTQAMRAQLRDGWCGDVERSVEVNHRYGRVEVPDGYRNFRVRVDEGHRDYCRDTGDLNETLTHGHLAMVMYAYHVNRHLESPAGVDYGARADFWLDYLRNDFEEKWRERSDVRWPDMDFISLKFCHTYSVMMLYHQFVGLRLLDDGSGDALPYIGQALRLTDGYFDVPYVPGRRPGGFIDVDTPLGPAVVYSFGAPGGDDVSDVHLEACPTTYARYMLTAVLALHLENVYRWDDGIMTRLANGLAHYVVGSVVADEAAHGEPEPFAAGVSGKETVAGVPPTEYRGRTSFDDYSLGPFAAYSVWDASDRLEETALQVYGSVESEVNNPDRVYIPASMLFVVSVDERPQ